MALRLPDSTTKFGVIALGGGLDQATPQLSVRPGSMRDACNFECGINGGYTRIAGYERFDGRPNPSAASYVRLRVNITGALAIGQTVTGATSGATGQVFDIEPGYVSVTNQTGAFVDGEQLRVGGAPQATTLADDGQAIGQMRHLALLSAAAAFWRQSIGVVPGQGPVRGLVAHQGVVYALRTNANGTAVGLWKSSPSGWIAVDLGHEVAFTGGSGTPPAEGSSITRAGVTARVRRVVTETGDWLTNNAAGRFIIDAPTGGAFSAGPLSAGATASLGGPSAAITLAPGGMFEFDIGSAGNGVRVYGCDGVNRAFEFDGATLVPINSGYSPDRPTHVAVHKSHLFLSFGSVFQNSGVSAPYKWTVISGGAVQSVNEKITAFQRLPGDNTTAALAVLTENSQSILYGNSSQNWSLVPFEDGTGAKAGTVQKLGQVFMLDDRGVMSLSASQAFGNFDSAAVTVKCRPFLFPRRQVASASIINRERSQYRVFFADGWGMYLTIVNGKFLGAAPVQFKHVVRCATSGESPSGAEESYFGSDDGFVYKMDTGTSFAGLSIPAWFGLPFAALGSPRQRKRFRRVSFEVDSMAYVEFSVGWELGYGSEDVEQPGVPAKGNPVYWDQFTWDLFTWDGRALAPSEVPLTGTAENIALRIEVDSELFQPFTINSATLHYSMRRTLR